MTKNDILALLETLPDDSNFYPIYDAIIAAKYQKTAVLNINVDNKKRESQFSEFFTNDLKLACENIKNAKAA